MIHMCQSEGKLIINLLGKRRWYCLVWQKGKREFILPQKRDRNTMLRKILTNKPANETKTFVLRTMAIFVLCLAGKTQETKPTN